MLFSPPLLYSWRVLLPLCRMMCWIASGIPRSSGRYAAGLPLCFQPHTTNGSLAQVGRSALNWAPVLSQAPVSPQRSYLVRSAGSSQVGTDIEDSKCSWLVVQALQRASPEQKARIEVRCESLACGGLPLTALDPRNIPLSCWLAPSPSSVTALPATPCGAFGPSQSDQ